MNTQKEYLLFEQEANKNIKEEGLKSPLKKEIEVKTINHFQNFEVKLITPKCFKSQFDDNKWISINFNKSRGIESLNFDTIPSKWKLFLKVFLCSLEQLPKYGQQHIKSFGSYQNYFSKLKHLFSYLEIKNIKKLKDVSEDFLREIFLDYSKEKTKSKSQTYLLVLQKLYDLGPCSHNILNDGLTFNPQTDYFLTGVVNNSKPDGETEMLDEDLARILISESINWVTNKKEDILNIIHLCNLAKVKKAELFAKNNSDRVKTLTHVQANKALKTDSLGYEKITTIRQNFGKDLIYFLEQGHQYSTKDISAELKDFMKILLIYKRLFSMYQAAVYIVCASFTGWRASEIFSINIKNIKKIGDGFELGTLVIKTTSNKDELIYRPVPELVINAISNLDELHKASKGLIENKYVKKQTEEISFFRNSLGNPTELKSLNEDLTTFGKYIWDENFKISTHQFRRFFAHFYVRRYKGTADAVRWHFRHISKDMILHYTSQALNAKQLASSKKELANDIANQILNNGDYKASSIKNRLSDIKLEAKVLAIDEAGKYIQNKIEEEIIDLHAMEWGYCVFQNNNKGAACDAKTGPIESRSEPSTCGRCKFLCTGKENIEFWQQTVLLHQDITQNKFVTPLMKKESYKMITIGINILNKHQERE